MLGPLGEFFIKGEGYEEHDSKYDKYIIDYNNPHFTQPSLWCSWKTNDDGTELIRWNNDAGYYTHEWLKYILSRILRPRGYELTGIVNCSDTERGNYHSIASGKTIRRNKGLHKEIPSPFGKEV